MAAPKIIVVGGGHASLYAFVEPNNRNTPDDVPPAQSSFNGSPLLKSVLSNSTNSGQTGN